VPSSAHDDVVGAVGRLTLPITASRPGEVVLAVRGGTEAFTAWADTPLAKNARVLVIEHSSARSVQVTPFP
jgi:hypothetical protein